MAPPKFSAGFAMQPIVAPDGILDAWQRTALARRIEADIDAYCQRAYDDGPRSHLGASEIGEPCARRLWLKWRWAKKEVFSGRMLRLFNRGHREEARYVEWLRGIGFEVWEVDPTTQKQFRIYGVQGHFGGSSDGQAPNNPYGLPIRFLCEFKTYNDKQFKKLVDGGVSKAKPQHAAQMNMYGSRQQFKYAIYFGINKNDDDIRCEVVELNWKEADGLERKAADVIYAKNPPPRIAENPSYFECKYCYLNGVCFHAEKIEVNCRSCRRANPIDNGEWKCDLYGVIPKDFIPKGCKDHWPIQT